VAIAPVISVVGKSNVGKTTLIRSIVGVNPPRDDHPLTERFPRKFAHSLKLVLPRINAPALRNCLTMNASFAGIFPSSASEPAVVCIRSWVSILSLTRTGIPCKAPRVFPALRSASSASAMSSALGFVSITEFRQGPLLSTAAIRSRYNSASRRAVNSPDFIFSWSSEMVHSGRIIARHPLCSAPVAKA